MEDEKLNILLFAKEMIASLFCRPLLSVVRCLFCFYFDPVCSIFMYGMRCLLFVIYHEDMGNAVEKDGPYSARHHVRIPMMEMRCSMTREMKEGKTTVRGTTMNSARHNTLTHILGTVTYSNNNTIRKDKKQIGRPAFKA